MLIGRQPGN